jgi:hypothetical protein
MGNLLKNRILFMDTALMAGKKCPDIVRSGKFSDRTKVMLDVSR